MFYPHVVEKTGRSEKPIDLPSRLLQDRIVYISGVISDEITDVAIMQMLWLAADDPGADINLYINSPGGSIASGLGLRDVIDSLPCKVNTIGVSKVMSMGAYLLSCGTGTRRLTKHCRYMIHSASSGFSGAFPDAEVDFEEFKFVNEQMMEHLSEFSRGVLTLEQVREMTRRDKFLSAEETIRYGLADEIVGE